ncbi:MAG: STAS domain-containing protein [Bacillota bacterium]|nr:STAS domain-containing protein [Bacillota bacterium]
MLKIEQKTEGNTMWINAVGRVDTTTAPELEVVINGCGEEVQEMIIDMEQLEYISSAGLRVILKAQKMMSRKNGLKLKNVNETIMEIFDITGFIDILTIE